MKKEELTGHINLPSLSFSLRILFTGYLIVISIGLATAGLQILMTHGMADGEFGVSVDDIVYSWHGNRENSKLESKLNGTMKDKANSQERATLVKWARQGAPRAQWKSKIEPIVQARCVKCHGVMPGLPDFQTYEAVAVVAEIDRGATIGDLARVSHIHLFGISFIFFFVCIIFSLTIRIPRTLKAIVIGTPYLWIVVDIFSWWLTKWFPSFAYTTIIGGMCYNLAAAFMILTSLYQMWILPMNGRTYQVNAWARED